MRVWTIAMIGAFALCAAGAAAQAASIGSAVSSLRASTDGSVAEKIAYRRCWWRGGKRVCRFARNRYYPYYPYYAYNGQYTGYGSSIGPITGIRH
jgi:hypothetical protein